MLKLGGTQGGSATNLLDLCKSQIFIDNKWEALLFFKMK